MMNWYRFIKIRVVSFCRFRSFMIRLNEKLRLVLFNELFWMLWI